MAGASSVTMNALPRHFKWCTIITACNNQGHNDAADDGHGNGEWEESRMGRSGGREPVSERMSEHASACLLARLLPCLLGKAGYIHA